MDGDSNLLETQSNHSDDYYTEKTLPLLPSSSSCKSIEQINLSRASSQIAIIGAKYAHVESLDYEIVANDIFKQDWRSQTRGGILQYIVLKWTLACLVGLLTGITGFSINLAVENIAGFKLLKVDQFIQDNRIGLAFSILVGSNLILVLSSALLCAYIGPAAAGSGIPEVKAYLNGIDAPNILALNTLIVKIPPHVFMISRNVDGQPLKERKRRFK